MEPNQNYDQTPQSTPPPSPPQPPSQPFNQPPQQPISSQFNSQPPNPSLSSNETNGFALAGIILAFLLPLLGLIFSIIGLKKAKNYNGKGKTLSIVGIILSSVFLLISLLILPALIITTINGVQRRANEASQNAASSGELGATYSEKSGAYSLKLPKGWQIEENQAGVNVAAFPPESTGDYVTTAILTSDKKTGSETLANIAVSEKENITSSPTSTFKTEKNLTINGVEGYEVTGTEQNDDGSIVEIYRLIMVKGDSIYRLTYGTSPDLIGKNLPIFKASAQTFKIK